MPNYNRPYPYQDHYHTRNVSQHTGEYDRRHGNGPHPAHWEVSHATGDTQARDPIKNFHDLPPRPQGSPSQSEYRQDHAYILQYDTNESLGQRQDHATDSRAKPRGMIFATESRAEKKPQFQLEIKGSGTLNTKEAKKEMRMEIQMIRNESNDNTKEETAGEELERMAKCLSLKKEAQAWSDLQYKCWTTLSHNKCFYENIKDRERALNLLVDTFDCLEKVEDQEKVIQRLYDSCEPDVNLEERNFGCRLLLKLSDSKTSTPKVVQRNADVLCQLVDFVDDAEHQKIILDSLQQHLINFPRTTTSVLFWTNILSAREENDIWNSPCLTWLETNLSSLLANHIESELELCIQLIEGWKHLKSRDLIRPFDVEKVLQLATSMRLTITSSTPIDLVSNVRRQLCTLTAFIVAEIVRSDDKKLKEPSTSECYKDSTPARSTTTVFDLQVILGELQKLVMQNSSVDIDELFALSPSSNMESRLPILCCLPNSALLILLRQLCNVAIQKDFYTQEAKKKQIQKNLVDMLVCLVPCFDDVDKSQPGNHMLDDTHLVEALLVACSIFMPIQRGQGTGLMETEDVIDRVLTLYSTSQLLVYELKNVKAEDGIIDNHKLGTATVIHRIATEYRKKANFEDPLKVIRIPWLEVQVEASEATLSLPKDVEKPEKRKDPESNLPEEAKKKQRISWSGGIDSIKKENKKDPLVIQVRGRGQTHAPDLPFSSTSPCNTKRGLSDGHRDRSHSDPRHPYYSNVIPTYPPRGPRSAPPHNTHFGPQMPP